MGGNVFKNGSTRRYAADEYFSLVKRLNVNLSKISDKFIVIPAYKDKVDFGDVDVLIIPNTTLTERVLNDTFASQSNVRRNGDVWSLVFEEIQVDLITTTNEDYDVALDYFSWNDFGNLRGKIIRKFGLKFGHRGLVMPVKDDKNIIGKITLSKNPVIINDCFDFIPGEFKTLEDMFRCVTASIFFSPAAFPFEFMNSVDRISDKKRSTYIAFLKHIESFRGDVFQHDEDSSIYNSWIFSKFPGARKEYNQIHESHRLKKLAATRFNGDLVRDWTGCEGRELGQLMRELKLNLTHDKILEMTDAEIVDVVKSKFLELADQDT